MIRKNDENIQIPKMFNMMFELTIFITKTNPESEHHTDSISCTFNYFLLNFPFFVNDKNT